MAPLEPKRDAVPDPVKLAHRMWVFLGFTFGMCLFIVLWATGLAQDAAGIISLAVLGIGILIQMAESRARKASS